MYGISTDKAIRTSASTPREFVFREAIVANRRLRYPPVTVSPENSTRGLQDKLNVTSPFRIPVVLARKSNTPTFNFVTMKPLLRAETLPAKRRFTQGTGRQTALRKKRH